MSAKPELGERERFLAQYREGPGNAYAWGKTARLLTEPFLRKTFDQTQSDIVVVDLCSSYPIYRQIMTGQHKTNCRTEVGRVAGAFINDLHEAPRKQIFSSMQSFDAQTLRRLRNELAPKNNLTRKLLHSVLFDIVCTESTAGFGEDEIGEMLAHGLRHSSRSYEVIIEPPGKKPGDKGTWEYMLPVDEETTFKKDLVMIMGERRAEALVNDMVGYFTQKLIGTIRGFKVVSLDMQSLKSIAQEAENSFPTKYRNTRYFRGGRNGGNYVQADIRYLPFAQNSVSFFSCIEGWPFYGAQFNSGEHISIGTRIADGLKPGGHGLFFPWAVQGETDEQRTNLEAVESLWASKGIRVRKIYLSHDELKDDMSSREYDLSHRSPVFSEGFDKLVSLVIEKPTA